DVAADVDRSNAVVYQSAFEAAGGRIQGGLYFSATLLQLDAGQPAQGQSYVLVGGSNRLVGDIPAGATVWPQSNDLWGNASLTVDHNLTNRGTIRLESVDSPLSSTLRVAGGFTLTNAAGGSIQIEGGSGGA